MKRLLTFALLALSFAFFAPAAMASRSITSVNVAGAQTPSPLVPGSTAQYGPNAAGSVNVVFGNGSFSGTCTVDLSVTSGLPSGATPTFTPSSVSASGASTQNSLLTIATTSGTAPGTYTFTVAVTQEAGSSCSGSPKTDTATLVIVVPPALTKSFAPTSVGVGVNSVLSLTISNGNSSTMTGAGVVDSLPTNMKVASPLANVTNSCTGTWSPTVNATSVTLSAESVPANGSCTVTVAVVTSASGSFVNTTNAPTSTADGTGTAATATLTVVGTPTKLVYGVSPSNTAAGSSITPAITVQVEDASNNIVSTSTASVTIGFGTNAGPGVLSGTTTLNAVNGVATFSNLSINKAANGYTLAASSSGLTGVTSGTFNIAAGTATQLVYTTPPSTPNNGGTAFGTQPSVSIEDALGNVVTTATNAITLAIGTNPVGGALTCTSLNPLPAIAGVATFVGCSINKASAGYTLTASASGLSSTTTGSITIQVGPATKIVFGVSPSNTVAGSPINPAVTVLIEDAGGNVTTSTASVGMAIGTNPGTSTLSGTTPQTAVNGTATFADLSLNKVGTAYTLVASASGFTNVTSATFNITVGTATQLAFTQQPGGGSGGTTWATASQPKVSVEDANGNVVTSGTNSNATITLAIGTNSGPGGTLTCTTNPLGASSGVSSFAGCKIDVAGTAYTLTAAAPGLTGATSNPFNITVGTGTQLQFGVQPSDTVDTVAINPAVTVKILDAGGNQTTGTTAITITILNNAGTGTLTGGGPFNAVNGLATFAGLSINKIGTGYTLRAAGTGVGNVTSNAFNILLGSPTQLTFSTEPASTNNHVTMPNVVVQIQDAGGNLVPTASAAVTVAIGANPSTGTLSGTLTQNTSGGAATFNDLSIDNVGTNYTLTATSSPVFTPETSTQFNITAGPASQLVFTTQPSAVSAPGTVFAVQPVVSVEDAHNNIITTGTGSTASITLAIGVNAGPGGVLTCTATTKSATAGVDAFAGCKINLAGNGYTLTAAASGFTTVSSSPFSISLGATKQIGEQLAGSCTSTTATCTIALNASALATSNNMLLVGVSIGHNSTTSPTVSGITWNGSALAPVASCSNTASNATGGNSARIEIWSLANPSLVSSNVVVTLSAAAQHSYAGAGFFSNVSALGTCTTLQSSGGSSSSASLSVTVPAGGASFDTLAVNTTTSVVIAAPPATQTSISNTSVGSSGGATSFGIAPISTMSRSWNQNTSIDAYGALSLIPTVSHKTGGKVIIGSLLEQENPSPSIFHLGDSIRSTNSTDAASPLADADQRSNDSNTAIINKRDN